MQVASARSAERDRYTLAGETGPPSDKPVRGLSLPVGDVIARENILPRAKICTPKVASAGPAAAFQLLPDLDWRASACRAQERQARRANQTMALRAWALRALPDPNVWTGGALQEKSVRME